MSKPCWISIGDSTFAAGVGDRILDAALAGGCDLPHECRSGQCGTCLVRVLEGQVIGGDSDVPGSVHACQAVVLSDLRIAHDPVPMPAQHDGQVTHLQRLARDVTEVTIATRSPFHWLPGQYASIQFDGFPARAYSPTVALDGYDMPGTFRLHIKHVDGGQVSSWIGEEIAEGHGVTIEGPYGSAFVRPGNHERLVLFAGGTGFAPIWSIADAVLRTGDPRPILIFVGAGSIYSLYMAQALERMSHCANVAVVPVVAEPHDLSPHVRTGNAADFASVIAPGDVVHAAGAPHMIEALRVYTNAAGVAFYADPFVPASEMSNGSLLSRAAARLRTAGERVRPRGMASTRAGSATARQ